MMSDERVRRGAIRLALAGAVSALAAAGCGDDPNPMFVPPEEETFDAAGSWTARGVLPEPLVGSAAAVWNGMIYVAGGYAGSASGPGTRYFVRFDPVTLDAERLADLPAATAEAAMVVYRDTLLVIGGNSGDAAAPGASNSIRWYDPAGDAWNVWASMPDARYQHTAQVVGDAIYVVGGRALTRPPGDSTVVVTGRDAAYADPPNRSFTNPVVGGLIGDTVLALSSLFEARVLRYVAGGDGWIDPIGSPLSSEATGGVLGGRWHAFAVLPQVRHVIFSPNDGAWLSAPPPPEPVTRAATLETGGRLFLIGGADAQRDGIARAQVYTPGG